MCIRDSKKDIQKFKNYLSTTIPSLENNPIVFTRRCVYTDTLDGHFWIDRHPEISNLTIGTGGSGHGLKMGPVLGKLIVTAATGGDSKWSARFRWRDLKNDEVKKEECRYDG